jgi:hypothetical protein
MEIVNCGEEDAIGTGCDGTDSSLIPKYITKIYYWYESFSYEGHGEMLLQHENGKWYYHNMGHCSCYGPLDELGKLETIDPLPLDELLAKMSGELSERCDVLVKAIATI